MLRQKSHLPVEPASAQSPPSSPDRLEANNLSSPSKSKSSKQRKRYRILEDLMFMLILHFAMFFIYASICSPDPNSNMNGNGIPNNAINSMIYKNPITDIIQKYTVVQYEPSYPQQTRIHNFPTRASQQEMAKHDRYIVHGLLYTEMLTKEYLTNHWSIPDTSKNDGPWKFERKLCINITTKNRSIPYINALIMTLMMSHQEGDSVPNLNPNVMGGRRLLAYAELNLLDAERDNKNYEEVRTKIHNLEFLHHYDVSEMMNSNGKGNRKSERLLKIQDLLASARICVKSGLPWCLMMEEFTVVPLNFLQSLQRYIISPLESYITAHKFDVSSGKMLSDGDIIRKKMSVLSLFSAYDSSIDSLMKVHDVEYSKGKYENDRAKLNSERWAKGLPMYKYEYELYPIHEQSFNADAARSKSTPHHALGGFDSAMLFHTSMVKDDLIPMLSNLLDVEVKRLWGQWARNAFQPGEGEKKMYGRNEKNFLDLELEFSRYTGAKRYRVEPSLVNRIGFYDREFDSRGREENDLGITNWLTDPRFLFEPGPYANGSTEYCESSSGVWIWDALSGNHGRSSCCDEEEAESKECQDEY